MITSIISHNDFIAEILQQYDPQKEIHRYTSIKKLQTEIDLQQQNIVIIDVDFESYISSDDLAFIKNYSTLVKIVVLNNHDEGINSNKITIITKPFPANTLHNLISNADLSSFKIYQISNKIYFNPTQRLIVKFNENENAEEINLTEKENELLHYLVTHKNQGIISKSNLLNDIFGYKDASSTHTLETHIYRLRNKISPDDEIFAQQNGGYALLNLK